MSACVWMTNRQRQRVLEMGDVLFFDGVAGCNDADFPCFMISALDAYGHVRCLAYALGDSVNCVPVYVFYSNKIKRKRKTQKQIKSTTKKSISLINLSECRHLGKL